MAGWLKRAILAPGHFDKVCHNALAPIASSSKQYYFVFFIPISSSGFRFITSPLSSQA